MKQVLRGIAAIALVSLATFAQAAQDVTAVEGSKTDIGLVGAAVFGVMVAIALTKWVRRAL